MTTGTNVIDRLNYVFDDAANSRFSSLQKLEAVNMAIDGAFPSMFLSKTDSSVTLAAQTYTYTPTATPELGFNVCYIRHAAIDPPILLRRVRQRATTTDAAISWAVHFPWEIPDNHNGYFVYLDYIDRFARLSTAGTTIAPQLPLDYLWNQAAAYLCQMALVKQPQFDTDPYEKLLVIFTRDAERAKARASAQFEPPPQLIPIVAEFGSLSVYNYDPGEIPVP